MQEQAFWKIIQAVQSTDVLYERLISSLKGLSREEILSFQNILNQHLTSAYTFPLLAANFVIESYVSDDGFRAFRAWLISQGHEKFTNALRDPETIADWLDRNAVDEIDGEALLTVAQAAYAESGGHEDEFREKIAHPPLPEMIQDWPVNKTEFRRRFPKLVDKYWNDERIREIHAD